VKDDYLWDGSGEPDPEVAHLEKLLGRYKHEPRPQHAPAVSWRRVFLAVAATIVIAFASLALGFVVRLQWRANQPWEITNVIGTPTLDGEIIRSDAKLAIGEELRTDAHSRVTVRIARVGELHIGPNSTVMLTTTMTGRHRMKLERGAISARVWAPPFTFGVRTPAGTANDLGCAFDLRYDQGEGVVQVANGWVEFENDVRAALIPKGALSRLSESLGPGSPHYSDATPAFRAALREYDATHDRHALGRVLATARKRDAMTLLHLLDHASDAATRTQIYTALVPLAPPPPGVTPESIDTELWRRSIGLTSVKRWWVHWRDAF
jgi:ferric-dicitrate binding protein FerR (iron transport regulator)